MSRASFDKLYHSESANKANGGHIRAWCRLALAIRYLAGAKLVDICSMFGIAPGTIYQYHKNSVLWSTLDVLDQVLEIEPIPWDNESELQKIADEFDAASPNSPWLTGTVLAIDGIVIPTRRPKESETDYILQYRNRKTRWAIVALAGCDAKCRFRCFDASGTGKILCD